MAGSAQKTADTIDRAIKASDEVKPGNYVMVKVEKAGLFGKATIVLTGRTTSERDKATIERIATSMAGTIPVESRLRVTDQG
jgi:osmotically-inducible protein OsmY